MRKHSWRQKTKPWRAEIGGVHLGCWVSTEDTHSSNQQRRNSDFIIFLLLKDFIHLSLFYFKIFSLVLNAFLVFFLLFFLHHFFPQLPYRFITNHLTGGLFYHFPIVLPSIFFYKPWQQLPSLQQLTTSLHARVLITWCTHISHLFSPIFIFLVS
jgi:hypothetical protein